MRQVDVEKGGSATNAQNHNFFRSQMKMRVELLSPLACLLEVCHIICPPPPHTPNTSQLTLCLFIVIFSPINKTDEAGF